ncbi:MAG: hypothetical protein R3Y50_04230 [Rikenellaceae bacterium]
MSEEYNDDYEYENEGGSGSNVNGYRIVLGVLVVLLIVLGVQYFRQTSMLRASQEELSVERDTLKNRLSDLIIDFDDIKFENDTLNQNMIAERLRADSLMSRLNSERQWSYAKIKKYESELGTLRTVMKGYVRQIDSLNTLNTKLSQENVTFRKEISSSRLRAEMAEEKSEELQSKIRSGAVVKAREISLLPLNSRGKDVSRASRATMLRMDCILGANAMTVPGERKVYVIIKDGSGATLTDNDSQLFEFEGEKIQATAMREVDYQNDDLAVGIHYKREISDGTYNVEVYMDGYMIGSNEIILK